MAVRAKARSSELYEQDLYAWSRHQADLLHRGRFAELDLEHLVEEIEDAGGSPRFYKAARSKPQRPCAPTASARPPTPFRPPVPTRSIELPATGCRARQAGRKQGNLPDTRFSNVALLGCSLSC
jgi:hypothetical protein